MKKKTSFQKTVKQNRKKLHEAGFHPATIHTWERGYNSPKYETAQQLSIILGIPLDNIPYFKMELNRPK